MRRPRRRRSPRCRSTTTTHRKDWVETLAGDDVWYFVAERGGAPVAHLTLYPDPHDDEALHIASTAVLPEARGDGVGVA